MLNVTDYQGNINENHGGISSHPNENGYWKNHKIIVIVVVVVVVAVVAIANAGKDKVKM